MHPPVRPAAPFLAVLCACLLAACGGSSHHRSHAHPKVHLQVQTVEVYSSLPLVGPAAPEGRAIRLGIELALSQASNRAGEFLVRYRSLNDARPGHGPWAVLLTAANARRAATDPAAVAYIGEFDSSASRISLPILNQAGIPQISPWSPYVGLTRAMGEDITAAGDPGDYYPTSVHTFLRLAPSDAVQAAALLTAARDVACSRLAVLRSGAAQDYSGELAALLGLERARFPIRIVSSAPLPERAAKALAVSPAFALHRYLISLRTLGAGCVIYVGNPSAAAVSTIAAIRAELPKAPVFASDRVCQAMFAAGPVRAQLAAAGAGLLDCTLPSLPAAGSLLSAFTSAWAIRYGNPPPPGPWGAYGYEAMKLTLRTIAGLGPRGDQRSRLLRALFAATPQNTLLGSYSFDPSGDSTVRAYGLWAVRASGPPRLVRVMQPPAG
ncbi:MAG TPA: ABC transporter substrate-binding protein [Solirubrobacteraceae bacterium]|nr:ABC transporter substrate-binding protein [Solirubrobacteraceae bacterium]